MLEAIKLYLPEIRKALIAGFVTLGLTSLGLAHITPGMTVEEALASLGAALVNGLLTWLVPNRK